MIYFLPFLSYWAGSKSVSARPSYLDTTTITVLEASYSFVELQSQRDSEVGDVAICSRKYLLQDGLQMNDWMKININQNPWRPGVVGGTPTDAFAATAAHRRLSSATQIMWLGIFGKSDSITDSPIWHPAYLF